ncbi:hypothetical protein [Cyclobacterium plantarum]|uniref:Uncharacterized protein n=1 Tax=Cyclobacterium plantarum TaxID=2716263 RepID=A0ABX0H8L3_9BACT|nr:hypothetical protein [Cyclobacterium plantarum]NHE56566.1 hypothetical protein [Cyclobacterium plantarum]
MRTDTGEKSTGGIRHLWQWHQVLPKLGLYQGRESEIPYDYPDLIRLSAPREVLVYTSLCDQFADPEDLRRERTKRKRLGEGRVALHSWSWAMYACFRKIRRM